MNSKRYYFKEDFYSKDIIRVKFKYDDDLPFYDEKNILFFDDYSSLCFWLQKKFYNLEIEKVEIDIIDVYTDENIIEKENI